MTDTRALEGVKVGDVLLVLESYGRGSGPDEVTVSRVGRKYLYVRRWGRETAYSIASGVVHDNYGHSHVRTPAQHAESRRRSGLLAEIKEAGWAPVQFTAHRFTTEQLEAVRDVVV